MTKARKAGAALACGMLISTLGACGFAEPSPFPTVQNFLIAWQVQNYTAAAGHTTGDRTAVAAALRDVPQELDAASVKLSINKSKIVQSGDGYDAQFQVKIDLGENGDPWTYPSQMHLRRAGNGWKIVWSPSIIHPLLGEGQRLAVVTETPPRAPILDHQGKPLVQSVATEVVGVVPRLLRNPEASLGTLAALTRLDRNRLIARVKSAPSQEFLPLAMLAPENKALIAKVKQIQDVIVKPPAKARIVPKMAAEFVGTLGPATPVKLQQVGAPYQPGDTIGGSGLQLLYQRQLASTPTVKVVAENPDDPAGKEPTVLATWPSKDSPQPVETTLVPSTQLKAEWALRGLGMRASMVVVRPSTGEVQAVANNGTNGRNLALEGQYPPGMTFGLVSAEALYQRGDQPGKLPCPATATVGGQVINNPSPQSGTLAFDWNFAKSCTTTLAQLSSSLDGASLIREASKFGLGSLDWGLTVPVFTGSVPTPANDGEKALAMIGQGKVLMSPLSMALVAASVNAGTWRPPQLLTNIQSPMQAQTQPAQPQVLPPGVVGNLQTLMRLSVASGTARKANVAGQPRVYGVTATVDYDQGKKVSWFVGYRGDVAFAIAVEGKFDAATIAAKFLRPYKAPQGTSGAKPVLGKTGAGSTRPAG